MSLSVMHDKSVMATGDDAAVSKLSAVQLGYFDDPFIKLSSPPVPPAPSRREGDGEKNMQEEGGFCPTVVF
jgi:hypothetical protein